MIYAVALFISIVIFIIAAITYIIYLVIRHYSVVATPSPLQPEHNAVNGIDNAMLRTWPTLTYTEARSWDPRVINASCCYICLVDYDEEDKELRLLPECGHFFHARCVDLWLQLRRTCPVCRSLVVNGLCMQTPSMEVIPFEIGQA